MPKDTTGGVQIECPDPATPSSWYSSDAQLSTLVMLPWMR